MARILIAEDEFLIALHVADELESAGHEIVGIAAGYDEAVDLARDHGADLAVLDVRLASDLDGVDLALTLRRDYGIPAILASGSDHAANVDRARPARPVGWLSKPFLPEALLSLVAAGLRAQAQTADRQGQRPDQPPGQP